MTNPAATTSGLTAVTGGRRLGAMRAIITTFVPTEDDQAVTFTLATTGPLPEVERDRLYDLFRSSTVVELDVQGTPASPDRVALAPGIRTEDR